MHKGIIIITKAENKESAIKRIREFLKEYEQTVWDWYQIGGRWSQTLSPFYKEFIERANKILTEEGKDFISQKTVNEKQPELQNIWSSLGADGNNPYSDHYKLPEDGGIYDVMPLSECIKIIKEWQQTLEDAKKEEAKARERWLNQEKEDGTKVDDWMMYGYQLSIASKLYQQKFFDGCNVYNEESWNYSIPEDQTGYYCVMVDIHS